MAKANLVPFASLPLAVEKLISREVHSGIPQAYSQPKLNEINQMSYAILKEGLFDLSARDIGFLGNMAKTGGDISAAQRKYLKDLCKKHLGFDFDEPPEGTK